MTTIFLSSSQEDTSCAEQIRQGLEAKGYSVAQEAQSLTLDALLAAQTPDTAILGSAAVVLLWSSSATQSEQVRKHLLFAQRLKKLIIAVALDNTHLPNGLSSPLTGQTACTDVVARLLPLLPAPGSTDPLVILYEQAAHPYLTTRKEASEAAGEMFKRVEHREEVLALLEYMADKDVMQSVREKAQMVLQTLPSNQPSPPPTQSQDIFPVTCSKGHVTYINVRRLCTQGDTVVYRLIGRGNKQERTFLVPCGTKDCGEEMEVTIDCEGY